MLANWQNEGFSAVLNAYVFLAQLLFLLGALSHLRGCELSYRTILGKTSVAGKSIDP